MSTVLMAKSNSFRRVICYALKFLLRYSTGKVFHNLFQYCHGLRLHLTHPWFRCTPEKNSIGFRSGLLAGQINSVRLKIIGHEMFLQGLTSMGLVWFEFSFFLKSFFAEWKQRCLNLHLQWSFWIWIKVFSYLIYLYLWRIVVFFHFFPAISSASGFSESCNHSAEVFGLGHNFLI